MSLHRRASLAIALAGAGGFGLPSLPRPWGLAVLLALIALAAVISRRLPRAETPEPKRPRGRLHSWAAVLALAALLALLGRSLARVMIAAPPALWATAALALAIPLAARLGPRARTMLLPLAAVLALAAALAGQRFEAGGPAASGLAGGGPVIGVHPRQTVAVRIDGFGPHDLMIDDYVEPDGARGYSPAALAERLAAELRAIADHHYADGPARAKAAFAQARVELVEGVVPEAELEHYPILLGLEVRSGSFGEGSTVEFVCPGQPRTPLPFTPRRDPPRSCPRKYVVDGSTGLGLSGRWPGYSEARGRDRLRLARALGWPRAEPLADRRLLALESGLLTALLVVLALGLGLGGLRSPSPEARRGWAVAALGPSLVALLGLAALALVGAPNSSASPAAAGGTALLAAWLVVLLPSDRPSRSGHGGADPSKIAWSWPLLLAGAIALLAASPLAGHGDAIALLDATRATLILDLGASWAVADALAAGLAALILLGGAVSCAAALLRETQMAQIRAGDRERRHTEPWSPVIAAGIALALTALLGLRKPGDDLALLQGGAALFIAASLGLAAEPSPWRLPLAVALGLAACLPLLADASSTLAIAALGLSGLLATILAAIGHKAP